MIDHSWARVKTIFHAALDLPAADRDAFIRTEAGDDPLIVAEVESLLRSYATDATFLERPAPTMLGLEAADAMVARRVGPYELVGRLGEGGMGEVYKARDTRLDRLVAIKMLPPLVALDPEPRARFHREAQAIAALSHPHICTLYDIGEHEGVDYLVMELLEGRTLAERLDEGPLPIEEALTCAIQIASALDRAHRDGIVHRDLKPANVMLTKDGAKLLDFGIAKLRRTHVVPAASRDVPALTGQGVILGTLSYMAPEQLEGEPVDARADIFAFGAIVYQMLTGKRPFGGGSQASIIGAVLHAEPPAVSSLQPAAPPPLDRVVTRCLAKKPDDRWQTARDLLEELKWIADTFNTTAPRRGARESHGIPWRRAAATVVLLIAAGVALMFWRPMPLGSHGGKPVVILMDSPLPERVYDADTRKNGGTNADDITDALRDLPVELHKETASAVWRREDQILQQNPALIVMHFSSFSDPIGEVTDVAHRGRDTQEKLRAFMGYVGLGNPRTKFLIYTRYTPAELDSQKWIAESEKRFPSLKGRVAIMNVAGGDERATFRDPATAREVVRRVRSMVGLP